MSDTKNIISVFSKAFREHTEDFKVEVFGEVVTVTYTEDIKLDLPQIEELRGCGLEKIKLQNGQLKMSFDLKAVDIFEGDKK